jgi:hypothetical protein
VLNGSVDPRTVGSPSGPVPVSTVASDTKTADAKLEERRRSVGAARKGIAFEYEELSEEQLGRMSAAEIRAVGQTRGYEIPDIAGRRVATPSSKATR